MFEDEVAIEVEAELVSTFNWQAGVQGCYGGWSEAERGTFGALGCKADVQYTSVWQVTFTIQRT